MELRYKREAAVGVLIVAGALLFVMMMMWLRGQSFRSGNMVHVVFDDVAGLKVGDPVRTSGVAVGQVRAIDLLAPGAVSVSFDVRQGPSPRTDAGASIKSADLFGARYVEYSPGRSAEALADNDTLRGNRAPDLSEVAAGFAGPARELLANAGEMVSPATTRELRNVLIEAGRTVEMLGQASAAPTRELVAALGELRRVFQRMDILLENNQRTATEAVTNLRDVSGNLEVATTSLTRTAATLDSLLNKVNSGPGAIGRFVNDSTLYTDLLRTNTALTELLVDIRVNPGRYFRLRF